MPVLPARGRRDLDNRTEPWEVELLFRGAAQAGAGQRPFTESCLNVQIEIATDPKVGGNNQERLQHRAAPSRRRAETGQYCSSRHAGRLRHRPGPAGVHRRRRARTTSIGGSSGAQVRRHVGAVSRIACPNMTLRWPRTPAGDDLLWDLQRSAMARTGAERVGGVGQVRGPARPVQPNDRDHVAQPTGAVLLGVSPSRRCASTAFSRRSCSCQRGCCRPHGPSLH
jgi:hypothetical protein